MYIDNINTLYFWYILQKILYISHGAASFQPLSTIDTDTPVLFEILIQWCAASWYLQRWGGLGIIADWIEQNEWCWNEDDSRFFNMEKKQMELLEDYICSFLKSGNFPVSISFFVYIKRLNLLAASIILVCNTAVNFYLLRDFVNTHPVTTKQKKTVKTIHPHFQSSVEVVVQSDSLPSSFEVRMDMGL